MKILKNRRTLNKHFRLIHRNKIKKICKLCNRELGSADSLRRHINSAGDRPRYPCTFPGCGKSFTSQYTVTKHVNDEHAGNQARFHCAFCFKLFIQKCDLTRHMNTHRWKELSMPHMWMQICTAQPPKKTSGKMMELLKNQFLIRN